MIGVDATLDHGALAQGTDGRDHKYGYARTTPNLLSVGMWFTITLKRRETFALDGCLLFRNRQRIE